jgi:hypothetical protein
MVHHFDHRFGTYEGQSDAQARQGKLPELTDEQHADPTQLTLPRYWVTERDVADRLADRWSREWLLGWRNVTGTADARTLIGTAFPRSGVGHSMPVALVDRDPLEIAALLATLWSYALDYVTRQKKGGINMTFFIVNQLAIPQPTAFHATAEWTDTGTVGRWIRDRVLELVYTSHDMSPFARDLGYSGEPFRWDRERRDVIRSELDAALFHMYGLTRDETDYVLDTFRIVRERELTRLGEFRSKRLILESYDSIARAMSDRAPYVSPLDPRPGDPLLLQSGLR